MNHISSYKQSSTFESNLGGGILAYPHTSLTKDDNKLHLVKSYSSFTVKVNIPSSALTSTTAEAPPIYSLCLAPKLQNTSTYAAIGWICSNECGERITNMFSSSDIRQIYVDDGTGEVLYYDHGYQISTYESLRTFDEMAIHLPLTPELCDKELTIRYVLKDNAKVAMLTVYTGIILIGIDGYDSQYFDEIWSDNYQTEIDVTYLDTSHVKCMYNMFGNMFGYTHMYDIKFVGLDKLDTSNVLDMRYMFYGLRPDGSDRTNKIDVSNFDFSKVQYFDDMFLRTAYYDDDIVVGKEKLWEAAEQLGYSRCEIFDVVPT